jgi:signal transduction histidine kinase
LTTDFEEKWFAFISILLIGGGMVFTLALLSYLTVRRSLRPLVELTGSLARLRRGNYSVRSLAPGPPEFAAVGQRLDELAATLARLSEENRDLVRKIVAVQDVERRDIARELHDEMGPHLFAIRAGAMAIAGSGHEKAAVGANDMLSSIKALQLVNRRILDRLRPMQIHEIGLEATLVSLIDGFRSTASKVAFRTQFDPGLSECDEAVAQTIYRVVQEGVVNALRHSRATRIEVEVKLLENGVPPQGMPTDVVVRVSDNGVGIPAGVKFGRGLTGMKERLRALGGSLALRRGAVWTHVEAMLPFRRRTHTVEESPEIVVLKS